MTLRFRPEVAVELQDARAGRRVARRVGVFARPHLQLAEILLEGPRRRASGAVASVSLRGLLRGRTRRHWCWRCCTRQWIPAAGRVADVIGFRWTRPRAWPKLSTIMGTWGHGNFDSDTAADHLSDLSERLLAEIRAAMDGPEVELEPDEYWGVAVPCNVELLALIAEQAWVGVMLPDEPTVLVWKQRFLTIWERSIDGLGPSPGHREGRRACLVATWDRLLAQVRAQG